jgi:hypothetical protein
MACSRRHIVDAEGRVLLADRGLQGLRAGFVDGPAAVRAMVRVATTPFGEPSTVLFRRDALTAAGPFSDRFASLSDCDLYARLLRLGGMAVVAETLATFRVHDCSMSHRSHHRQASDCRRLLRELAADPAFAISQSRLWQGLTRAEFNALGRRAVYAWARLRDRRPPPRHGVADRRYGRTREPLLAATGNRQHTASITESNQITPPELIVPSKR